MKKLAHISLLVKEYDEAIEYYTKKLGFYLIEDTPLSDTKRWVLISPEPSGNFCLLLAKAANEKQISSIGNQTGGRVFLFLHVDNFEEYYAKLLAEGIEFTELPRHESYGKVVVFKDLYGNLWDLIEKKN